MKVPRGVPDGGKLRLRGQEARACSPKQPGPWEAFDRSDDRAKLALMSTTRPRGWCLVLSFFTACGPSIGDGDGDGDGTAEASGSTQDGVSQTSDADATRDDTSSSQGETEDAPPCAAPATAPALESEEIAVEGILEFAVADLVGSSAPELLLVTEQGVRVVPGSSGTWDPTGGDVIESDVDVPRFIDTLTVADVLGSPDLDVVVVDDEDFVEVWEGDGSGRFAVTVTTGLMANASPVSPPVIFDVDADGQPEIGFALQSGEIAVLRDVAAAPEITLVPTGLTGADWMKVVPSPVAADEPAYAFVGGYRLEGGYNLVWAPVDAMDAWHEALVPFIHIGDMTLDVDGEGTPRWTAIEGIERAHIAFSSFPFEPEAWQIVDTGELSYFDALELVSYDGGYDVAAIVDGAIVLADLDCGTSEFVDGVFVGTQLRAVDIDGDRQRDLIARGELGVVTYRTGG